jgi:N-acyl-D-aspartate/D-glutamate deacylase
MFDLIIRNGRVIDGSGNPWFSADVAISKGKITKVGRLGDEEAERIIEAEGLIVAPGFIDVHTHNELTLLINPKADKIGMGVTTEIGGLCGVSAAPVIKDKFEELVAAFCTVGGAYSFFVRDPAVTWDWSSFGEYMNKLESLRFSVNFGSYVGHLNLRVAAMGLADRQATPEELERMKELTNEAMYSGAYGLAAALSYTPADTQEITELCKVVAHYGGHYAQHDRDNSLKSTQEGIEIAEKAGIPLQLSHHAKAPIDQNLRIIDDARDRGVDITMDHWFIPYGGAAGPTARLPLWALEGGMPKIMERLRDPKTRQRIKDELWKSGRYDPRRWESTVLRGVGAETEKRFCNLSFAEIARQKRVDPFDALFDMFIEAEGQMEVDSSPIFVNDRPPDLAPELVRYMQSSLMMIGSDSLLESNTPFMPDPRAYGVYPGILEYYVREKKYLPLEDAIRKMTSLPAQRFGLRDRGLLREGMWADIIVFDKDRIKSLSVPGGPEKANRWAEGIHYILVNGQVTVDQGEHTGALAGKILRYSV